MFSIVRRGILALLLAGASIVFWKASHLGPFHTPPAPENPPPGEKSEATPSPPQSDHQPWSLIPGPPGQRFLAWALFVLLLPIVAAGVTNQVLQKESNTATLILLFGYTGLDVVAAWLVGGIQIGSLWSGIGYLIALLALLAYNLWVCSVLAKLQE